MVQEEKVQALLMELGALQPSAQDARVRDVDASGDILVALADEAARTATTDTPKAIELLQMIRTLADRFDQSLARCRARRGLARALSYAGRFEDALATCEEAVGIARSSSSAELAVEAGRAGLASMHALTELGRLEAALTVGQVARQGFIHAGEPTMAARADINLGIVYQRRDDPSNAVACFDRARGALGGAEDEMVLGHLENSRGEALLALNDFDGSQRAFRAALQNCESCNAHLIAAIVDGNLADLAARQGHLDLALFHFERARRRFEVHRSPTHLARLLAEQAEAKALLGLPGEALIDYEATLPDLDACGLALEAARARAGIGMALLRLGRPSEAGTPLAAAATGFDDLGHATARARVDLIRAELLAINNRLTEARNLVLRSMSVLADRPADVVSARHQLGRLALQSNDLSLAVNELNTAVGQAQQLDLPPLLADLLHTRGRVHLQRKDMDLAIEDLTAAVEAVERVRGTLQADRLRAAYLGRRSEMYEHLMEALLDRGAPDCIPRAFGTAEQAKSRALLDQIGAVLPIAPVGDDGGDQSPVRGTAALEQQLRHAQAHLNGLYSRLADAEPTPQLRRIAGRSNRLQDRIRDAEHELDTLRGRLSITSGTASLMAPTAALQDVQRVIDAETRLIEYTCIGDELVAFVIGHGQVSVHRHLCTTDQVTHHLSRLRFQIDRALRPGAETSRRFGRMVTDTHAELAELWDLLIAPIEDELAGATKLTIVPHGPLHLVPFHALWDREAYLFQSFRIHYAPSASVLSQLGAGPVAGGASAAEAIDRAVVVGVADDDAPHIDREASTVVGAIGCPPDRVLLGERATVDAVTAEIASASIVHLACHGRFLSETPLSSGLRLADRWLTVRDIYNLGMTADLVTLSGCETGINSVTAGDELVGLLRGFFAAGARSLLVSLWRTHDEATAEFMRRFYERWRAGGWCEDKSLVLADVQLAMLQRWDHPAYWASFVLMGRT